MKIELIIIILDWVYLGKKRRLPVYFHVRLIARGKRQVVADLSMLSSPLQFRSLSKWLGGGIHHLGGFAYEFNVGPETGQIGPTDFLMYVHCRF